MDKKTLTSVLLISLCVSACSTRSKAPAQPQKTIASVMSKQNGNAQVEAYRQNAAVQNYRTIPLVPLENYTRTEANELRGIFPRLPNPDLCMYVFPHLSLENATVPGYSSCFSMYDKNHYALPGEMSATWQATY